MTDEETDSAYKSIEEKLRLYLGTGCGKTTATFGLSLRAISRGKNVTIVFFDKLEENSSEGPALHFLENANQPHFGNLSVHYTGVNRIGAGPKGSFRFYNSPNGILAEDIKEANRGLSLIREALLRADDLVIADELLNVAHAGLIEWEAVKEILSLRQDPTVIVMTGRNAPEWLKEAASTVSVIDQLKHHGRAIEGLDC